MALACAGYEKEVLAVHARLISLSLSPSHYKLISVQLLNQWQPFLFIHHFTQIDIFSKCKSEKMPTDSLIDKTRAFRLIYLNSNFVTSSPLLVGYL